ncbi:transketolase [Corynebacterium massiliense]|uniref:Transketolase n=1 Tax=Corynebacterium massiliense DSM 45435 TaxID=1121364 RepID=A0ABY7U781_9CORY|nr:Transketolase [Corynebacterium massiliense DSM 45435]
MRTLETISDHVSEAYFVSPSTLPPELQSKTVARYPDDWTDTDTRAVDTARVLAAEAVENCGSGHPGTAMSLAPLAYTLYQRQMVHDPADVMWLGRDRFVLSCGHSSLTQYIQLFLGGFGLEMEDLKQLRTWGSKTPGHPEFSHTDGVEITTGPLGQGLASSVGMAMAARKERGLFDPDAPAGESPFDHFIFTIASDGDLQEGVTSEASSIAGTQKLGNLIVFWDDNEISIEDNTNIAFTENVVDRYAAYGWQVLTVESGEDVVAIEEAIAQAKADTTRPTFIRVKTVIGYPSPTKMNTGAAHGAALGQEEVDAIKNALGFDPNVRFHIDDEVLEHTRRLSARSQDARRKWQEKFDAWAKKNPEKNEFLERFRAHELPADYDAELPSWDPDEKGIATRKASGKTIQALAKSIPELWGGSADLAGSNNTAIEGADSFGPETISTDKWTAQPFGRNLHFGIREHAMSSIMNGIALHGNTRVYGGTFLIFSEYMFPAVRLGALMQNDTYYVWTHDSIGLGEDGPTHQPVETLAALRTIPHLSVIRPADANETAQAWAAALEFEPSPKGLCLTRQNVPVLEGTKEKAHDGVRRGAYTLVDAAGEAGTPDVILIGTGSEVQLAVEAARRLGEEGIAARVVSAPCLEWFDAQDAEYRESVLPSAVRARVSVEAGIAMPWHKYTGDMGENISLEHFGASAPYTELYENFGITADAVYTAAKKSLAAARGANA